MNRWRTIVFGSHSFLKNMFWSHLGIALIGIVAMFFGVAAIYLQASNVKHLSQNSIPVVLASSSLLKGVEGSLASLRGWVSLGEEGFVQDWGRVWKEDIDGAVKEMELLGAEMNLPGFEKRMVELHLLLAELKESQYWVVEVAQTPGNEPARVRYQFEVEPILRSMDELIKSLHQLSGHLSFTIDNGVTVKTSEFELVFYEAREQILKIIFQGEIGLENRYFSNLHLLSTALPVLASSLSANRQFVEMADVLARELIALQLVSYETISLRKSGRWNVVRHLMETETVPLARKVAKVMGGLNSDIGAFVQDFAANAGNRAMRVTVGLSFLFVCMVLAVILASTLSARKLSRPVTALAGAAGRLASGSLTEDIPVTSEDELGDLTRSFNAMRRTLEETQQKMVRQERLVAIGKLSGSVAHDIRNPLGAISNSLYYLRLIGYKETDDKVQKHIAIMEREIQRASEVINDLMDFSKENEPRLVHGDINRLIKKYIGSFLPVNSINIVLDLAPDLPQFFFDHIQMERVVDNLITNAVQSMGDGGKIRLSTRQESGEIELKVKDEGIGIERKNMNAIFEPLFTTKSKGVGLGLSIIKTFIEKHSGTIEVESEVGRGTLFTIRLPFDVTP